MASPSVTNNFSSRGYQATPFELYTNFTDVTNGLSSTTSGWDISVLSLTTPTITWNTSGVATGDTIYTSSAGLFTRVAIGTSGKIYQSDGTKPTWSAFTVPTSVGAAGTVLRSDGTNWLASTFTISNTFAINGLVYASAANTLTGLATANAATLVTSGTGVPSLLALTNGQLAIGSTGVTPVAATLTGTANEIDVTNAAGSITIGIVDPLILSKGGTGSALTADNGAIPYSDTSKLVLLASTITAGKVLQSGSSAAPAWSTPTYPSASGTAGKILRSDGTNNVYSTSTFADTYSASNLLYSNGANTVTGLATANAATLVTSGTGVPSLLALTNGQLAIGSTGATPVAATLTGAANEIDITNAAGSITIGIVDPLILSKGGTGSALTADNGAVPYSDASKLVLLASTLTAGKVFQSGASAAPSWSTPTYPSASGAAGKILRADGTNNLYSTFTIPDTFAISTIPYASAANVLSALATANYGLLNTGSTGVPSITATPVISTSLEIGVALTATGILKLSGTTSGTVSTTVAAAAGSWTFTLPTGGGTNKYALTTNGAGVSAWSQIDLTAAVTGTLPVGNGGTGAATFTSNGVLYGNGTSALQVTAQGGANTILTANAGAPAWSSTPTIGGNTTVVGTIATQGGLPPASTSQAELGSTRWRLKENVGDEGNAGVIDYRGFDANSLSIVGAGTTSANRRIYLFDSVGIATPPDGINGNLAMAGTLTVNGTGLSTLAGAIGSTGGLANNQTSMGVTDFNVGVMRFLAYGAVGVQGTYNWLTGAGGAGATSRMTLDGSGNLITTGTITGTNVLPDGNKTRDLGSTTARWNNIYVVTSNGGTSRLAPANSLCKKCNYRMSRGTGVFNVMGEKADYITVWCENCGNMAKEEWNHLPDSKLVECKPPPLIKFLGAKVRQNSGHTRGVQLLFSYGKDDDDKDICNSTVLSDYEYGQFLVMNHQDRYKFIRELGLREWYALEEVRLMQEVCKETQDGLDNLTDKMVGKNLLEDGTDVYG